MREVWAPWEEKEEGEVVWAPWAEKEEEEVVWAPWEEVAAAA